ncbi:MAG: PIN domain-containing protein [Rhodobacteraceae bacterium]|nr:PIN domain-containing protein [Paracoccaceae bacterium]MCY4137184.1 PIN domain-containing protein [Paracoccaceae bacterium]
MTGFTALLDANILYPAPMRDIFLQMAADDVFRAKWTEDIHREWIDALIRNEPHRDRATLEHTRRLMDRATRDCLVTGYEPLIPALNLPDPDDRHVLAAAIAGHCDVIVTCNLRDFPEDAVMPYGIEVLHPDTFLSNHLDLMPDPFCEAVRKIRERLVAPPISVQDYLTILAGLELIATAAELARYSERL